MTDPNPYQPPSPGVSVPVVGIEPPLKKTSVWFILLMSFITFGFYPVYWFTS